MYQNVQVFSMGSAGIGDAPTSKNIISGPAGATEISILSH
jgi:hypothetical protein